MTRIKGAEFLSVEYDESLFHEMMAIAKIYLEDLSVLEGVLIYYPWSGIEPEDYLLEDCSVLSHHDYEELFHGRMGVRFPLQVKLSNEDKRIIRHEILVAYYKYQIEKELQSLTKGAWEEESKNLHPYWLDRNIEKIDWAIICKENKKLSEEFLRKHIDKVDFKSLSYNQLVTSRLSSFFKKKFGHKLEWKYRSEIESQWSVIDIEQELAEFGAFDDEEPSGGFVCNEDVADIDWDYHDVGQKIFEDYFEPSEMEIDEEVRKYTKVNWDNVSAVWKVQWLEKFIDKVNWSIICEENKYLTEEFLNQNIDKVKFHLLESNEKLILPTSFIEAHFEKFNWSEPGPSPMNSISYDFLMKNKEKIRLSQSLYEKHIAGRYTKEEEEQVCKTFNLEEYDLLSTIF